MHSKTKIPHFMKKYLIALVAVMAVVIGAAASQPVKWRTSVRMTSPTEGTVTVRAIIPEGFHLYGMSMPEGGPKATSLDFTGSRGITLTGSTGFAAQAKISREQVRSQNKENLMQIIDNPDVSEEQKAEAVASMVTLSETAEREAAAEVLLESKGFPDVVVNLTGNSADVVVPDDQLDDTSRAQIEDIVKRKTEVAPENIVITPLSQASE